MFEHRRLGGRRRAVLTTSVVIVSGVASVFCAVPALADTAAQQAARTSPAVAGTPCTAAASACVDVHKKKAWLIKNGKILRGPVPIATGGPGEETPTGDVFRVYRKDKTFKSTEFKLPNGKPAPMPDSVFFEDGGIAFHSGDPKRASAGCVHLNQADAQAFYDTLQLGDHVQVKDGPVAAPKTSGNQANNDSNSSGDNTNNDDSNSDNNSGDDNHDNDN